MYNDYRPSGLLMDSIERSQLVSKYYYSQSVINQLRADNSKITQAAWLLITIWMWQQQIIGFQPVRQAPMPPHLEPARNLLFGQAKPDQLSCRQLSRFDSCESISKNSPDYRQKTTFFDSFESETINRSLDHLLSKHGHNFGIRDLLPTNPKQKASPYLQP